MKLLNSHSATDTGLKRDNNEDCYLSSPNMGLWVIADGMGGHEAGEVASDIVIRTLEHNSGDIESAILSAHQAVLKAIDDNLGPKGMGSTVVSLKSTGPQYQIAWVGDSRAYCWTHSSQGDSLQQLTTDHSYVQALLSSGAIEQDELQNHPDKNIITQCIGSGEGRPISVESIYKQWGPKQWVIMCSDGLTDELNDSQISDVLKVSKTPTQACENLISAALDKGGRDNITVQVIESPKYKQNPLEKMIDTLPPVSGHPWIDGLLYGTALLSGLLIAYWSLG